MALIYKHGVILEVSEDEWRDWYLSETSEKDRIVGYTKIGRVIISTVFLAIGVGKGDKPFETMVFEGELDGLQYRYYTAEEAEEGHRQIVACVALGIPLNPTFDFNILE